MGTYLCNAFTSKPKTFQWILMIPYTLIVVPYGLYLFLTCSARWTQNSPVRIASYYSREYIETNNYLDEESESDDRDYSISREEIGKPEFRTLNPTGFYFNVTEGKFINCIQFVLNFTLFSWIFLLPNTTFLLLTYNIYTAIHCNECYLYCNISNVGYLSTGMIRKNLFLQRNRDGISMTPLSNLYRCDNVLRCTDAVISNLFNLVKIILFTKKLRNKPIALFHPKSTYLLIIFPLSIVSLWQLPYKIWF